MRAAEKPADDWEDAVYEAEEALARPLLLGDEQPVEISYLRKVRIAVELRESLCRQFSGVDPAAIKAAANNLATCWGELGITRTR
jgi:hypothetical protein